MLGLGLLVFLWKPLEGRDTRGSRCNYVGVYGSSWKLPRNIFKRAYLGRPQSQMYLLVTRVNDIYIYSWKLQFMEVMEASTNFHGSKSTSTDFHGNFDGSKSAPPIPCKLPPWK